MAFTLNDHAHLPSSLCTGRVHPCSGKAQEANPRPNRFRARFLSNRRGCGARNETCRPHRATAGGFPHFLYGATFEKVFPRRTRRAKIDSPVKPPFQLRPRVGLHALCAPRYVRRGGEQDITNPFHLRDCAIDAFFFRADYDALRRLVSRDLDSVLCRSDWRRPLGLLFPRVRIVPLVPIVMLVCAQTARIEVPGVGWMPEVDVGFWIPVLMLAKFGPFTIPWEIGFYQPYLFVDSGQAMATGRETYGYHKMLGEFDLPSDPEHPEQLEVRAIAWREFGSAQRAQLERVFTLRETSGVVQARSHFGSFDQARRTLLESMGDEGTRLFVRALDDSIDLLDFVDLIRVQQVFLKQFRAIEDPSRACYQAVSKVGAPLRQFHRGGLLPGRYELDLADLASLPIRDELGLGPGTLTPFASFWGVIDFDLELGTTLSRT